MRRRVRELEARQHVGCRDEVGGKLRTWGLASAADRSEDTVPSKTRDQRLRPRAIIAAYWCASSHQRNSACFVTRSLSFGLSLLLTVVIHFHIPHLDISQFFPPRRPLITRLDYT